MMFEITVLVSLTLAVVGFKFFTGVLVLQVVLSKESRTAKWIVSAGLAQVSEYAFVLGSRALKLGLISREVYLLVLGLTTLSLLLAPVLWRATWFVFHTHRQADIPRHNPVLVNLVAREMTPEKMIVDCEMKNGRHGT
ncbi:transmembrane and coiled-coil domain-containing protein 3-like [Tubulanus polymorphus]|uniref:transmembrane and coiled-coil domain-containing protein 3-like n=1 Tax=Tubulanus polymorphus TaxID=672921 RepID=UPI003DA3011F